MSNQLSGQSGPSPKCYTKHQRHRRFARIGIGANQFSAYLAAQATRLTSTSSVVFGKLNKYKAVTVTAAANLAAIP